MNLRPLVTGSRLLLRQFGGWLLPGQWRTAGARLAGCTVTVGFAFTVLERAPFLMWLLAGGWCVAAWRIGRTEERTAAAEAEFVQWIWERIGGRNGVLLAELLAGLHAAGMHTEWDVTDVRAVVERLGIPVRDAIKVSGSVSIGVHVDDLTGVWDVDVAPPPAPSESPSPAGLTCGNYPTTPRVTVAAEGAQTIVTPIREGD